LWKAAGVVCDLFKPDECLNYTRTHIL
jgi:hypothetical protein